MYNLYIYIFYMKNMCLINLFNMVNLYGHFMLKPPGLWRCPWPAADHRGGHIKGGLVTRGGTARLMFEEHGSLNVPIEHHPTIRIH